MSLDDLPAVATATDPEEASAGALAHVPGTVTVDMTVCITMDIEVTCKPFISLRTSTIQVPALTVCICVTVVVAICARLAGIVRVS